MRDYLKNLLTFPVLAGALAIALLLGFGTLLLVWLTSPASTPVANAQPTAILTVIPGPSATPRDPTPTFFLTPTTTQPPAAGEGDFPLGGFVQITDTGGTGLNLRAEPGLSAEVRFLGYDSEVFEVRDGPRESDGYIWWFLVTPVDESRSGWAAEDFLSLVENP